MAISCNPRSNDSEQRDGDWASHRQDYGKGREATSLVLLRTLPVRQGRLDWSNLMLQGEKNPILLRGVAFCALEE